MLASTARRCILVLQLATAFSLAGCENYASDVAAVKQAQIIPGLSNEDMVLDLAGARASIAWAGDAAEGDDSGDLVTVTAVIKRVGQLGMRNTIELYYTYNRQTKDVALDRVLLNGKRQAWLAGAVNLMNLNLFKLQLQ